MSPEFSVILPTRGNSEHLRATLKSALDQDVDLEVLLAHDRRPGEGPLDPGLRVDPRVRPLEAKNPGLPGARNTAIRTSRGGFLALLDDDDIWLPGYLGRARAALQRDPDAILVATDAFLLEDASPDGCAPLPGDLTGLPRFRPDLPAGRLALRELLLDNPIVASAVVLVRDRLTPEDRFDQRLPSLEDYDLWLRLSRRHALLFEPAPAVVIRRRRGAMSRNWRRMAECGLEVLDRYLAGGLPRDTVSRAELRGRLGGLWHDLAYACLVEDDLPAARAALREAIARCPLRLRNYLYLLAGALPRPMRRLAFARGRRALAGGMTADRAAQVS